MDLLRTAGLSAPARVGLQALSFGLAHAADGVPDGSSGAAGATVLGVVLGCVRERYSSLRGCVVAHFVIDCIILAIPSERVVFVG